MLERFERMDLSKYRMQSTPPANPAKVANFPESPLPGLAGLAALADPPCSDSDFSSSPDYWHALAASGLGDMDVIPLTEALFLFALRKVESTPADDLKAMWDRYADRWRDRLPEIAFRFIETAYAKQKG